MRHRLFCLFLLLTISPRLRAAPLTLVETDFGAASQPVTTSNLAAGKDIAGVTPEGWHDDSTWNEAIRVRYRVLTERGKRFWRVENGPVGRAQIAYPLPDIKERQYYDLTVTVRGHADSPAECGIRLVGSPYTNVGPFHLDLAPQWQTYHLRVPVSAQDQGVGFWFNFSPGIRMDIGNFRLQRLDQADLIAEIKTQWPNGGRGNLARVTRFPLGLPVGWAVPSGEALGKDVTVATDQAVIGPSGTAALCVAADRGATLSSAPFCVPWTFAPHVLSLALRGKGTGQIVIRSAGSAVATQGFTLTDDWQRVVVPFTPLLGSKAHDFQIEVTGTAWLDALQVEQGSSSTPYTRPEPAEVALACPPSDAGLVRVQFADEPDRIVYAVAGAAAGDLLRARVTTIYGDTRTLPPKPLPRSGRGSLRYALFPNRPYGPFRVEAWVTDARGQRRSAEGEIVVSRLRRPRFWGRDAIDSPFGVHINPSPQQALLAKAIGANWVRTHDCGLQITGWSFIEPTRDTWQFDDAELAYYRRQHLEVLGMLSTAPGWATSLGRTAIGYWDRYVEPNSMDDWAEYVRRTVTHYQGAISYYEVWNEPAGEYWGIWDEKQAHSVKTPDSSAHFALLQQTAYQAAKAAVSSTIILGFSDAFTQGILAQGILPTCDVLSYHHYTAALNGGAEDEVGAIRAEALKPITQMTKPVWLSEGNSVNGMLDVGMYKATVPGIAPDRNWEAANRLTRFVVSLLAHGDQKIFLYTMHEDSTLGAGGGEWRTLLTADGYLHPCGAAYAALTWQLEGLHAVKTSKPARGVTAFAFAAPGRSVTIVAGENGHAPFTIPGGRGQRAVDLFGNPLAPGARLGDTPIYITQEGL